MLWALEDDMSNAKNMRKLVKRALRQGWVVEETRKGLRFCPPNPNAPVIHVHKTPSDWRAMRNVEARLRRWGLE